MAKPLATSRYILPRPDWLALRREVALEPDLPIIDPHHHLFDRSHWRYLFDEFHADLQSGHNIIATVHVQARSMHRAHGEEGLRPVGETEFANGVAAMAASGAYGPAQVCAGIVGYADLTLGAAVERVFSAHLKAGGGRFRGIRHIVAWNGDPEMVSSGNPAAEGLMKSSAFRAGFARLAAHGLTFDAWLYHTQLAELEDLARAFPETDIVVDHYGGPLGIGAYAGRRQEVFETWRLAIKRLADCPNVFVKLGGLGMYVNGFGLEEREVPPSSAELATLWRPYFDTCVEAFGCGRLMFESNFPVDKGSYGYAEFWNACKILSKGASHSERADLFSRTASRVYSLKLDQQNDA